MRNNCRVVLTDKCNLDCEFCCMKQTDICNSFKWQTALWIAQQRYDEVAITGGDPLMELKKLVQFICLLKYFNENTKTYLYTNGCLLNTETARVLLTAGLDGINWSPHHHPTTNEKETMTFIHMCLVPIRVLIQNTLLDDDIIDYTYNNKMPVKVWTIGDCDNMEPEARFRLDWSNV